MHTCHARFQLDKKENRASAWQPLPDHLRHAASRASAVLQEVGLGECGYTAGLLHDLGKYSDEFQQYLHSAAAGEKVQRGSVNHSFAGVRALVEEREKAVRPDRRPLIDFLAYAVGAHHGLFDCMAMDGSYGIDHRLQKEIPFDQVMERAQALLAEEQLSQRLPRAVEELLRHLSTIRGYAKASEAHFALGLLARLLASAVMEGDRTDSASFEKGQPVPDMPTDRRPAWESALQSVEDMLRSFPTDTPVQRVRSEISDACLALANHPGGIFRLTVPAGGGKTFSVLRAALAHAKAWNKTRILFVMPLLAIIEQNAREIRRAVGDALEVLEHHSNIEVKKKEGERQDETQDGREWLTETWHHPLIVTTLFQLLMTLFSSETGCVRRFQALCNSVIIIDEVQNVPQRMLSLWNGAVNFLANCCGATVILCSATQPVLEQIAPPIQQVRELVTLTPRQLQVLRRTTFHVLPGRARTLEEVTAWMQHQLEETPSLLVVCNTRREAVTLTKEMTDYAKAHDIQLFHLSAAMCPAHRTRVMENMKSALHDLRAGEGRRVLCIATQVMDAGVDVSFHCMLRFLTGADTVVQTAGRVNRHGESSTPVPVYMVDILDERLTGGLSLIQEGKNAAVKLLDQLGEQAEAGLDLADAGVIRAYYGLLYGDLPKFATHYPIPGETEKRLFDMLGQNNSNDKQKHPNRLLHQAFRYGGDRFEVFDSPTRSLVIPFSAAGAQLYQDMLSQKAVYDWDYAKELVGQSRQYTVSVFQPVWDKLANMGVIVPLEHLGVHVLMGHYSDMYGIDLEDHTTSLYIC